MIKCQGVVVLFKPNDNMISNIDSYISEWIIVEDGPLTKEMYDLLDKYQNSFPELIRRVPLKENKGIAFALNVGAIEAINSGANWLLTMDQDSRFEKKSVSDMKKFIELCETNNYMSRVLDNDCKNIGIISPFHVTERTKTLNPIGVEHPLLVILFS